MSTPSDLKQYGREPAPMPTGLKRVCQVLIAIAVIGTAYGLVADEADKVVVMSRSTYEQTIREQRIQAAQEMAEAVQPGACGWRDAFREERQPKVKRGAM